MVEVRQIDVVKEVARVMLSDSVDTFRAIMADWMDIARPTRQLWRVLCADVVYNINRQAEVVSRRTHAPDEFMFVTWALMSRKSPFHEQRAALGRYVSSMTTDWYRLLISKMLVVERNTKAIGLEWFSLYPEETVRREILREALRLSRTPSKKDDMIREELLIDYAMSSESAILELRWRMRLEEVEQEGKLQNNMDMEAERRRLKDGVPRVRLRAWEKVPWDNVYTIAEPELSKRVGDVSESIQLPYDIQISIMDQSIMFATKARRLYTTKHGYIGLGPADLAVEDRLYLVKGGNTPLSCSGATVSSLDWLVIVMLSVLWTWPMPIWFAQVRMRGGNRDKEALMKNFVSFVKRNRIMNNGETYCFLDLVSLNYDDEDSHLQSQNIVQFQRMATYRFTRAYNCSTNSCMMHPV
jgi:hypothetical protein